MKKACSLLLAFVICIGLTAAQAEGFTFRSGVSWGASEAEIRTLENAESAPVYSLGSFTNIELAGTSVSRYQAVLSYLFLDSRLAIAFYDFGAAQAQDPGCFQYLTGALTTKYGMPEVTDPARASQILDHIAEGQFPAGSLSDFSGWSLSDGTLVAIFRYSSDAFMILYADEPSLESIGISYDLSNL